MARIAPRHAWILVVSAGLAVAQVYHTVIDAPHIASQMEFQDALLRGDVPSPYRYRVLLPALAAGLQTILSPFSSARSAFDAAHSILEIAGMVGFLAALLALLRRWYSLEAALIATLFGAATLAVTFRDHFYQPWTMPEAVLLAVALRLLHDRRLGWFAAVVAVASLNRETGVFLGLLPLLEALPGGAASKADRRRLLLLCAASLAGSAIILVGLRLGLGWAAHSRPIGVMFAENLGSASKAIGLLAVLLGGWWFFVARGAARAPGFLRRASLMAIPYLGAIGVFGTWHEVRLFVPLYPLLLGLGLAWIEAPRGDARLADDTPDRLAA